jgi:hypothetical protein
MSHVSAGLHPDHLTCNQKRYGILPAPHTSIACSMLRRKALVLPTRALAAMVGDCPHACEIQAVPHQVMLLTMSIVVCVMNSQEQV